MRNSLKCSFTLVHPLLLGAGLFLLTSLLQATPALAVDVDVLCVNFYQKAEYEKAGICFQSIAAAMGTSAQLSKKERYQKGSYLRNSAMALRRAALKKGRKTDKKALLLEKAFLILSQMLKEKLCGDAEACKGIDKMRTKIKGEVGYGHLTIDPRHTQAKVLVTGYQYKKGDFGTLKLDLRPGSYVIAVTYPNRSKLKKKVTLKSEEKKVVQLTPPKEVASKAPSSFPTFSKVAYLGGAVALITGGVLFGIGQTKKISIHNCWDSPTCKDYVAVDERDKAMFKAELYAWLGIGLGVVGGGLLISGLIVHQKAKKKRRATAFIPTNSDTSRAVLPKGKAFRTHFQFSIR